MTVLRESPWYQEILQQGIERGVQQGIERGVQQERQASLIRILQLRFGDVPSEISMNLQGQDLQGLEGLMAIALSAVSLDEFRQNL